MMGSRSFLRNIFLRYTDAKKVTEQIEKRKQESDYDERAAQRAVYGRYLSEYPIEEKTIFYEAFAGRGMICNPYAIFRYLLSQEKYSGYMHVWVIDDFEDNAAVIAEYADFSNVKFVPYLSEEYMKYLAVSKYLINNVSFLGFFAKREGQIYLNTWHGVPMKTMGFDIPGGRISSGNSAKNMLSADYLISSGNYMTNKAYWESYKLDGIFTGTILENGFPRNDAFFHPDHDKIFREFAQCGVEVDPAKKIILYAPTWRGEKYSNPQTDIESYLKLIEVIERNVDTTKYQVLVKPHQIVYYHIKKEYSIKGKFIPAVLDTNEILAVTDILISDYSSIHFDFLVSGRPEVFFIPDFQEFTGYRGIYFSTEKLPGPVIKTYEELGECFRAPERILDGYTQKYQEERQWACPLDDGNVCARTVEEMFEKEPVKTVPEIQKKKLLLYAGNFNKNRVTSVFLSFLNILDTDTYDVTILIQSGGNSKSKEIIESLPPEIRCLYWKPFYAASEKEWARHCLLEENRKARVFYPEDFYKRELSRAFGDAKFDAVISFRTDNTVFNGMMAAMKQTKRLLYVSKKKRPSLMALSGVDYILCSTDEIAKVLLPCRKKHFIIEQPIDLKYMEEEQPAASEMCEKQSDALSYNEQIRQKLMMLFERIEI